MHYLEFTVAFCYLYNLNASSGYDYPSLFPSLTMKTSLSNLQLSSIFFVILSIQALPSATLHNNETDKLALMSFKQGITEDPLEILSSWNESVSFCDWNGVVCSRRHQGRVIGLKLNGAKLGGSISPHIGNLSFLRYLYLGSNRLQGHIPQEVGHLSRLRYFNLSDNSLQGKIPGNLSSCFNLQAINLLSNQLSGEIPDELEKLSMRLYLLYLDSNSLTGQIPPWLGNFSSLKYLALGINHFRGSIPGEIGGLLKLRYLQLSGNNLTGIIPPSIYNISSLQLLYLGSNQLHGEIPQDLNLPYLREVDMGHNRLSGRFPASFTNASQLEVLLLPDNQLNGPVPLNLGSLRGLKLLGLSTNQMGNSEHGFGFLTSLTNCSSLQVLEFGKNNFTGEFPSSITKLSTTLERLSLRENRISGNIPQGIGNLTGLNFLSFSGNFITGEIPSTIGQLKRLVSLYSGQNGISGPIPPSIGNLTQLLLISMEESSLNGTIPPSFGNLLQLETLSLSHNRLSGNIPKEVLSYPRTHYISLSQNLLTGSLPQEIGNMSKLVLLDISQNRLVGGIPGTISKCLMLELLQLQENSLEGSLPLSLSDLKSLKVLDLSRNNFSGQIPKGFQNFTLMQNMNLSFNNLQGEVPNGGVFLNTSAFAVTGNERLCGGIKELRLPPCKIPASQKRGRSLHLTVAISVTVSCMILLLAIAIISFFKLRSRGTSSTTLQSQPLFPMISYGELSRATNNFSQSNLIGEGSFGSVYKGADLNGDGNLVAVKVLNLKVIGAAKSFLAECEALRNIRHRNIIKIITVCSGMDFKRNDFKAIVYEFMQNGSLDPWLHPSEGSGEIQKLSLMQRLNISIDVASAIEYLHYHCGTQIIHGDLKPSNVLLSHEMVAHVADFGLARFLPKALPSATSSSSTAIKGTVGYVAPEYGLGTKASMKGDVYSFGILLLEIITGRRPTDKMFEEGFTLHQFIKVALPERIMDVIEPSILQASESNTEDRNRNRRVGIMESLAAVANIGLLCSMESEKDRPDMKYVLKELCSVREKFLGRRI